MDKNYNPKLKLVDDQDNIDWDAIARDELEDYEAEENSDELTDEDKNTVKRLRDINLPSGLMRRVIKQYLVAAAISIISIWFCIYYKEVTFLVGLAIAGWVVYMGIGTTYDYAEGKITELAVLCASVNEVALRKQTRVIFRTADEIPTYFEFLLPGKRSKDFSPNFSYVIYYKEDDPKNLLGYVQL